MADKGFVINDLLEEKNVKLVIPPLLRSATGGTRQFSATEVCETQENARLRIHVERAIRRFKENRYFDRVQPLVLAGSINQLWSVCCFFNKFQSSIILKDFKK